MLNKFKLSTKILGLGAGITVCFSLTLIWAFSQYKDSVRISRYMEVKKMVQLTLYLLEECEARGKAGEFSLEEGKKRVAREIKPAQVIPLDEGDFKEF